MSLEIKGIPKKASKKISKRWIENIRPSVPLELEDIEKLVKLNKVLNSDAKKLGIKSLDITITPKTTSGLAYASSTVYKIIDNNPIAIPSGIRFDYRLIKNLKINELRAIAWHELGHYIFAYYFPAIERKRNKSFICYMISEVFADEFAINKFGQTYLTAVMKIKTERGSVSEADKGERMALLKEILAHRERYHRPYWLWLAKKNKVSVQKDQGTYMIGVKPKIEVLNGMFR
jgi:hypothetical protein